MKKHITRIYMGLILFLMYAPILTLIVLSFNSSKTRAKWGGFTGKWYVALFQNDEIMQAFYNTLIIAMLAAAIATVLGTMAAIGMNSMKRRFRTIFMGVTNIPMLNGEIVMGISLMLLFIIARLNLGFSTILMSHITFNIPYVILSVMPKLKQTKKSTYEAALDLGASPIYAFFKVVFPDIMPGVLSGFLLSFTMSLDDFVITYFTKGPGVDTLSTKIYSEVRKGIKPEMYALSTLLFVTVLFLLILINMNPSDKNHAIQQAKELERLAAGGKKRRVTKKLIWGRIIPVMLVIVIAGGGFYYGNRNKSSAENQVIVYNWGEYIDPEVLDIFEEETGIKVIYEEFETNEIMFPKIQSGAIAYDLVCPSDYMINKMLQNDLLAKINWDNVPNASNIGETYYNKSKEFDPTNEYSVPYCWGTLGIVYNKTMVDEPVDSWEILWDSKYKNNILMQDSVRDAFSVSLKSMGYSTNSTNIAQLNEAQKLLIAQKPLVQAYVVDQMRDKMIGGEAALGVTFSGELLFMQRENPDLDFVLPKEGGNVWIDSWVIPKNAQHKENAEKFLNFLCRPDIALMNFDYITYATPNTAAREMIEDPEVRNNPILFPDDSQLENCETFKYLGTEVEEICAKLWREVKSS